MSVILRFSSIVLLANVLLAAGSTSGGPVLGYVFNEASRRIEPVRGIPGAAMLDGVLDPGLDLQQVAISSARSFALGVSAQGGVYLLRMSSDGVAAVPFDLPASPQRIVLSPSGRTAALGYADRIRVVTGLPDNPDAGVEAAAASPLAALAVSDDGVVLAGGTNRLLRISAGQSSQLPWSGDVSAIAFRSGAGDAAVAGEGRLILIHDVTGSPSYETLAERDDGLSGHLALAFSSAGSRIAAAQLNTSAVKIYSLAGAAPLPALCHCSVTALESMDQEGVFRLNTRADGPLMLLEVNTQTPRITFVAAQPEASR